MQRKLMDMESSFLPEPSTIEVAPSKQAPGIGDTLLIQANCENTHEPAATEPNQSFITTDNTSHDLISTGEEVPVPQIPSLGPHDDFYHGPGCCKKSRTKHTSG